MPEAVVGRVGRGKKRRGDVLTEARERLRSAGGPLGALPYVVVGLSMGEVPPRAVCVFSADVSAEVAAAMLEEAAARLRAQCRNQRGMQS